MNGRDEHIDELLSAYLDGELTDSQRQEVDGWLAESREHQRLLDDLRRLLADLGNLPAYRLDDAVSQRILRIVAARTAAAKTVDPASVSDELLGAYLDDEVTGGERELVESVLIASEGHRQRLAELDDLRRKLKSLPTFGLDDGFADRVLQRAEREMLVPAAMTQQALVASDERVTPNSTQRESGWRGVVWAVAAVAAAVALMVVYRNGPGTSPDPGGTPEIVQTIPPDEVPREIPREVEPPDVTPNETPRPEDPTLQLVNNIRKNCGRRMILVYEILVKPEGVKNNAFANVLRRHSIRFNNTVPIPRDEQAELLKERYLANVEIVDSVEPNMDEVDMFVVSCTGRIADDLYFDLKRPPDGIGGFMLNLATIDPEQGVMHRLCEAADLQDGSNTAVELLVSFAMLSETTRNLGVFGSIGYVEPILINPTQPAGEQATGETSAPDAPGPREVELDQLQSGEFPCELLFVVRNLREKS